jgi:hypothetical protein
MKLFRWCNCIRRLAAVGSKSPDEWGRLTVDPNGAQRDGRKRGAPGVQALWIAWFGREARMGRDQADSVGGAQSESKSVRGQMGAFGETGVLVHHAERNHQSRGNVLCFPPKMRNMVRVRTQSGAESARRIAQILQACRMNRWHHPWTWRRGERVVRAFAAGDGCD